MNLGSDNFPLEDAFWHLLRQMIIENVVTKGLITHIAQVLLLPQCFQLVLIILMAFKKIESKEKMLMMNIFSFYYNVHKSFQYYKLSIMYIVFPFLPRWLQSFWDICPNLNFKFHNSCFRKLMIKIIQKVQNYKFWQKNP